MQQRGSCTSSKRAGGRQLTDTTILHSTLSGTRALKPTMDVAIANTYTSGPSVPCSGTEFLSSRVRMTNFWRPVPACTHTWHSHTHEGTHTVGENNIHAHAREQETSHLECKAHHHASHEGRHTQREPHTQSRKYYIHKDHIYTTTRTHTGTCLAKDEGEGSVPHPGVDGVCLGDATAAQIISSVYSVLSKRAQVAEDDEHASGNLDRAVQDTPGGAVREMPISLRENVH